MKPISFLLFAVFLIACSKNDCRDNVTGVYSGNCSSNIGTFQGDMTISNSSTGESNLLIKDQMLDSGVVTYNATVSSNCKTITVPSQSIISGGVAATISGTFQLNGSSLTGNLNLVIGSSGTICSYNLTKR
jgi:hypothetical protein